MHGCWNASVHLSMCLDYIYFHWSVFLGIRLVQKVQTYTSAGWLTDQVPHLKMSHWQKPFFVSLKFTNASLVPPCCVKMLLCAPPAILCLFAEPEHTIFKLSDYKTL